MALVLWSLPSFLFYFITKSLFYSAPPIFKCDPLTSRLYTHIPDALNLATTWSGAGDRARTRYGKLHCIRSFVFSLHLHPVRCQLLPLIMTMPAAGPLAPKYCVTVCWDLLANTAHFSLISPSLFSLSPMSALHLSSFYLCSFFAISTRTLLGQAFWYQ